MPAPTYQCRGCGQWFLCRTDLQQHLGSVGCMPVKDMLKAGFTQNRQGYWFVRTGPLTGVQTR